MLKRLPFIFLPVLLIFLLLISPLLLAGLKSKSGFSESLRNDTVSTSGIVTAVGPSAVGNDANVVTYSYDVAGYPRNGKAGSFTREQVVEPGDLAKFKPRMSVPVEYSRALPGSARIKGYGTGNVYLYEMLHDSTLFFILFTMLALGFVSMFRGTQTNTEKK